MRSFYRIFRHRGTLLALLVVEGFLLFLFPPNLIFTPTLATGGDTLSHYLSAVVLRDRLFCGSSLFTWVHGNYAGFPLFLNYFPLPFFLTAILSLVTSLQVAFKLTTLLAIFPLPIAVYGCLRNLGYRNPTPLLGCAFSVLFLVMNGNSMWGGNIASTLAGEFAYGLSFILAVHLMGKLYRDVPLQRSLIQNGFIEALVALSNGYPLLQIGLGSLYFIFTRSLLPYVFLMHAIAFGMIGFWILPLLWHLPWDTAFIHSWSFQGLREIVPCILWPALGGIPAGWASRWLPMQKIDGSVAETGATNAETYLWWQIAVSLLGFALSSYLGLVDVRFLPFAQLLLVVLGAIGWGKILRRLQYQNAFASLMMVGVLIWALPQLSPIPSWVHWNYSGVEAKPLWPTFHDVAQYLNGTSNDPRVVYEHSDANNGTGTVRSFEMLPIFCGRSTLEGLYMQSSVSSPFVFYLQSELSLVPSCPFPNYYYARFNLARAAAHLRLLNVSQIIAVTEETASALDRSEDCFPELTLSPFRIYRLARAESSYVVPLRYRPYRIPYENWKEQQFEWFRRSSLEIPLVVTPKRPSGDYWSSLPLWSGRPENLPKQPILGPDEPPIAATAHLENDRITVETSKPMHPLWLKVSYHPAWRVKEGEGELYLASPSFMLLVPHTSRVVLVFDTQGGVFWWGRMITFLTWMGIIIVVCTRHSRAKKADKNHELFRTEPESLEGISPSSNEGGGCVRESIASRSPKTTPSYPSLPPLVWLLVGAAVIYGVGTRTARDPILLYNHAVEIFDQAKTAGKEPFPLGNAQGRVTKPQREVLENAQQLFESCVKQFPLSPVVDHAIHHLAVSCMIREKWKDAERILSAFLVEYPDTRLYPEALYYIGICNQAMGKPQVADRFFWRVLTGYPESPWAEYATERLLESTTEKDLLGVAEEYYRHGSYSQANPLLAVLAARRSGSTAEKSLMLRAFCLFYQNRWQEAARLMTEWLGCHHEDPEAGRVAEALAKCHLFMGEYQASRLDLQQARAYDPSASRSPGFRAIEELVDSILGKPD